MVEKVSSVSLEVVRESDREVVSESERRGLG